MIVQIIVDYSFLYYKYKFQLDSGKMRRLTAPVDWKGAVIEKDISQIYYSIKEIEGFRRGLEKFGHNVFISVCFDMPPSKELMIANGASIDAVEKYKSNRAKHLSDEDFENIQFVERLLSNAGYNTYRIKDYESDDIIAYIVKNYSEAFDYNLIYTPDLDILTHIGTKVGVSRYKALHGYTNVSMTNFEEYLSSELKCIMPYNGLILYKSTVGDKSDCIDGIKKFGPKAFNKLVEKLTNSGVEWPLMGNGAQVRNILQQLIDIGYFTPEQGTQAISSLGMVIPKEIKGINILEPTKHSNRELREASYMTCGMKSLID